jgi:hypothetical protein
VGTGSIGRNHARVLAELDSCEFAAIYDTNEATAREIAAKHGTRACSSLEEFVSLVDAATVATPTSTHSAVGTALLEAGKHVLMEKPITENDCGRACAGGARYLSEDSCCRSGISRGSIPCSARLSRGCRTRASSRSPVYRPIPAEASISASCSTS